MIPERHYQSVPVYQESNITDLYRKNICRFDSGTIAIPANIGYALVAAGEEFIGFLVSPNGEEGFKRSAEERYFIRLCPNFVARTLSKPKASVEATVK